MENSRPPHRLEELIQEHRPVVKRIAEACAVDYSTVWRWRKGGTIPAEKLPLLAAFFGVSVNQLMGWTDHDSERTAA